MTPAELRALAAVASDLAAVAGRLALVCAWHTPRTELEAAQRRAPHTSHGICPACAAKFAAGEPR